MNVVVLLMFTIASRSSSFSLSRSITRSFRPRLSARYTSSLTAPPTLPTVPITAPPKLLTLDATGTLITLRAPLGVFYRDALFSACGNTVRLPGPETFTAAFFDAYAEESARVRCFGGVEGGGGTRNWWRNVVKGTYDRVQEIDDGIGLEGLREELANSATAGGSPIFDAAFDDLYDRIFAGTEAWELTPYAEEFVSALAAWRESGAGPKAIGVVSNFDERLHCILSALKIRDKFDFVVTSAEVGYQKPEQGIFDVAKARAGMSKEDGKGVWECVHVGDNFEKDVRGATGAGFHAVFLPNDGGTAVGMDEQGDGVRDYFEVPDLESFLFLYGKTMEDADGIRILKTTRDILELGNNTEEKRAYDDKFRDVIN